MYTLIKYPVYVFILLLHLNGTCGQLLEGLYCGKQNCYDVLSVNRDSSRSEISKSYRQLAKKYHPDVHHNIEAKREAEIKFKEIATAYEILRDEESRSDYDYMLDNPQEYYAHYYRYYRRRVSPKVDVRLVLIVSISVISIIQYYSAWQRYESAIKYFLTVPKYRLKAAEIVQSRQGKDLTKKSKGKLSKAEQKEENEKLIRQIIEENMDIKGAYAKPEIKNILWVQLLICPYTIFMYIRWYIRWIYNFTIMKKPYGDEEKFYLIRKNLGMGQNQFNAVEESTKIEYLELELWIKHKFIKWKKEKEEEIKLNLAENPRYKQYRRYMRNHEPRRMTFED
ncbi:DnaJ like subfamily C member 25 like [Pseudolycoriella hygida]|uniref:DnaJ like subfamily C member 25 like n=1 Tax=Pseudolycoriella hygida TaxID=35572 RepID=A0A9Q0MXC3_9DIPT|nr:DnaJ like subfamily C member 25 like [Pseudolycoriella hygida]